MSSFKIKNIIPKQTSKYILSAKNTFTVAYIKTNASVDGIFIMFLRCKVCSLLIFTQMCYTRVTEK